MKETPEQLGAIEKAKSEFLALLAEPQPTEFPGAEVMEEIPEEVLEPVSVEEPPPIVAEEKKELCIDPDVKALFLEFLAAIPVCSGGK